MNPEQLNSDLNHISSYSADLHIHTAHCGHAKGSTEEVVQRAVALGLKEIGFTGHFPYPDGFVEPVPNCVIPNEHFPKYVSEILELQEVYKGKIIIEKGFQKKVNRQSAIENRKSKITINRQSTIANRK